jgi:hypothetical protein
MQQQAGMQLWKKVGSLLVQQVLRLLLATMLAAAQMLRVIRSKLLLALVLGVWQQQCGWVVGLPHVVLLVLFFSELAVVFALLCCSVLSGLAGVNLLSCEGNKCAWRCSDCIPGALVLLAK